MYRLLYATWDPGLDPWLVLANPVKAEIVWGEPAEELGVVSVNVNFYPGVVAAHVRETSGKFGQIVQPVEERLLTRTLQWWVATIILTLGRYWLCLCMRGLCGEILLLRTRTLWW